MFGKRALNRVTTSFVLPFVCIPFTTASFNWCSMMSYNVERILSLYIIDQSFVEKNVMMTTKFIEKNVITFKTRLKNMRLIKKNSFEKYLKNQIQK